MFCRESVRALRAISSSTPGYPTVLFFFHERLEAGHAFFARLWPEARGVCDLAQEFYAAFGLGHGSLGELAGLPVWIGGVRAVMKGNIPGRAVSDPTTMPGAFLVRRDEVLWAHRYRHAADHPDFNTIPLKFSPARTAPYPAPD
jgi:hypothetical protein